MRFLTVLTQPVPAQQARGSIGSFVRQRARRFARGLLHRPQPPAPPPHYGGHYAVTRSCVEGLQKLGVKVNYNPDEIRSVASVVVVLAGIDALRQAIAWKREGRIECLLAGPNLVQRAYDFERIILSPELDVYLQPSDWPRIALEEDAPALRGRIRIWAAGVDTDYWQPVDDSRSLKKKDALVYWKTESEEFVMQVEAVVRQQGWNPMRLKVGDFSHAEYKCLLAKSTFAVFLSRSESQGIALAEAWSMDVPTLVWNPKALTWGGKEYSVVSACPYLTESTGFEWQTLNQLNSLLTDAVQWNSRTTPRRWVLNHMSDSVAASRLVEIIHDVCGRSRWNLLERTTKSVHSLTYFRE